MSDLKRWVDEIEGADGAERLLLETARDDDPGDDQTRQLWARLGPLIGPLGSPPSPASPPPTTPPSTAPPALPPPVMPAPLAPAGAAPAAAKIGALAAKKALVTAGLTKALAVGGLGAGLAFGFYDGYATRSAPETRATTSASASAGALAPGKLGQLGQPDQPGGLEAEAIAPTEPGVELVEPGVEPVKATVAPAEPAKPTVVPAETRPLAAPTGANRAGATSSQAIGQGLPASMASALLPTLRPTVGLGAPGLAPPSTVGPSALEPTPAPTAVLGAPLPTLAPIGGSGASLPTPTTAAGTPGSPAPSPIVVAPQVSTGADPAGAAASAARPRSEASTAGRLVEESRLVVRARDELRRGQAGAALRTLDELGRSFPAGALTHERAALEVQALAAAGRREQARAKARAFVAAHPSSPLAPVVGQFAQ